MIVFWLIIYGCQGGIIYILESDVNQKTNGVLSYKKQGCKLERITF